MHWQVNPYALLLTISGLVSTAVAIYAWRRRPLPGATYLILIGLAAAVWSLGYAAATGFSDLPARILLAKVQWLGIGLVSLAQFLFVVEYTRRSRWLTTRNLVLLCVIPVIGILLAWTNQAHGLIWASAQVVTHEAVLVLDLEYGPVFWLYAGYSYLLLVLSAILLLYSILSSSYLQIRQSVVILVALLLPWLGNFMYLTGWNPLPYLDWTPFAYSLSGLLLAWGLFRYRLLEIVPVARAAVIESMADGILVLDEQVRIVDANPAAQALLAQRLPDIIGQPADQILATVADGPAGLDRVSVVQNITSDSPSRIVTGQGASQRTYSLLISPLKGRHEEPAGYLAILHDITQQLQAENALLANQRLLMEQNTELQMLTQAIEQSANAVVITNKEGDIEYVNPKFAEISGYEEAEALGQNPRILQSGEQDAAFYAKLWETITSGEQWRGEFHNKHKDGSTYWEQASIAPVWDAAGQITHYIAVKEDITARKEAQAARERYAERLKTLNEIGQSILAARLPETIAVSAIRKIRRLVGCQRALVLAVDEDGRLELLAADSGSKIEPLTEVAPYQELMRERILSDGWVQGVEDLITVEQDSILQQTLLAAGIRSYVVVPLRANDELVGTLHLECTLPEAFSADHVAIATEVAASLAVALRQARLYEMAQAELTERKVAEKALREREQFLALLNDITRVALETPDLDTMLQPLAQSLGELFAADGCYVSLWDETRQMPVPVAAYGRWQEQFLSINTEPNEATITASVLKAEKPLVVEDLRDTPYLSSRIAELFPHRSLLGLPLVAGGQKLGGALVAYNEPYEFGPEGVARGEQAAAQIALALAKAQLVETLQETIGELQAYNEELDAFAHTVAHDLKNPVSTVVSYADMLDYEYASSPDKLLSEFVPVIAQHGHKMGAIIDDLLLLSSVRGMDEMETVPLDMGAIVGEALERLHASIEESEAAITLPPSWPSALGYAPWVEEVWTNYISNALKYGGRPPRIELGFSEPAPAPENPPPATKHTPCYISFWVSDNGPGLSSEDQARLFTPFERLHQVKAPGQGLGLSIVQRIARKLGGWVGVESPVHDSEGSRFYFVLPAPPPS